MARQPAKIQSLSDCSYSPENRSVAVVQLISVVNPAGFQSSVPALSIADRPDTADTLPRTISLPEKPKAWSQIARPRRPPQSQSVPAAPVAARWHSSNHDENRNSAHSTSRQSHLRPATH